MAGSSSWSLLSLPLLALAGVAEALCPHCTEDPTSYEWDSPLHYGGCRELLSRTRDLVNLAATCKDLHYIALPILYHLAQCYPHRRVHLLRTLARRPDLARRVKVLRLDFPPISGRALHDKDDRAFVLELAARHGWPHAGAPGNKEEYVLDLEAAEDVRLAGDLSINLLLALCPNLKKVTIDLRRWYRFDLLQPGALPHLKDVFITTSNAWDYINLGDLRGLYHAAPSIESFTSCEMGCEGNVPLPWANLRHLSLDMCSISPAYLSVVLTSCPQLESFSYFLGGCSSITTTRRMRFLFHYAPQLKHLDLHIGWDSEYDEVEFESGWDEVWDKDLPGPAPGFASLSHLETLVLDGPKFLDEWRDQRPVATLFPRSLRSLTLIRVSSPRTIVGVGLREFIRTSRSFLPNLTSLTVRDYAYGPSTEYLKAS
jgi:hypothetical protein